MQTDQGVDDPKATLDSKPGRGGKTLSFAFGFLAAVVLWQVVNASVWIANYEPLGPGSLSSGPRSSDPDWKAIAHESPLGNTEWELPYTEGTVEMFFSVRNSGKVGVRVEGIHDAGLSAALFEFESMGIGPAGNPFVEHEQVKEFAPFVLGSGEERLMRLDIAIGNCEHSSADVIGSADGVYMDARVLRVPRTMFLDFRGSILVPSPSDAECPSRKPPVSGS